MTGKQLKNAILQLAIQGKLVAQDPSDEPASALLARIRKEKEQLVKANKKDLETTPIADDEKPFEIPESWEWVRIQEISDSYIGLTYKPTDVAENGKVVLRSSNIQDGKIDLNDKVKVNLSIPEKLIVHENDILICARNGSSKLVGKSALITKEADGMTFGAFMAICKTSFYDFVYQFLQSDLFFSQLREVSGTTTINQLTQKNFNSFIIPLPPLAEQRRIVAKIEELMPLVEEFGAAQEKLNRLNEALPEALKNSILQQAIQGKLVPQDATDEPASALLARIRKEKEHLVKAGKLKKKDLETTPISDEEKPFEIPESWEWVRLGEICRDFIVPQRDKPTKFGGDIPWCRIEDIEGKYLNGSKSNQLVTKELANSMNMHICPKGTVICACSASIGNQAITTTDCYTNQTFIGIVVQEIALYNEYLYYFFMSQKQALKDIGKGTTISYISRKKFEDYIFPLPPLAEQRRIVARVEELMELVEGMK